MIEYAKRQVEFLKTMGKLKDINLVSGTFEMYGDTVSVECNKEDVGFWVDVLVRVGLSDVEAEELGAMWLVMGDIS